jgi:hypothetical protein
MTNEELKQELDITNRKLEDLKQMFLKDNFPALQIFRKKLEFKDDITIDNVDTITATDGTATISNGNHTINIGVGGGSITITTKNGIITAIS